MNQHCKAKSCTAAALPSSGLCYMHTEAPRPGQITWVDDAWPQPTGHFGVDVTEAINAKIRQEFNEAATATSTPPKADAPPLKEPYPVTAADILHTAAKHMQDRAATYDQPQGERSISKTVTMFNTLTEHGLTEEQGWLFMTCLKMVRAQAGRYRSDSYEDGAAYFALAGESAAQERI